MLIERLEARVCLAVSCRAKEMPREQTERWETLLTCSGVCGRLFLLQPARVLIKLYFSSFG